LGKKVVKVSRNSDFFSVALEDGTIFNGHAVVYCAGKEYTRLGVPGEDRFIGRGIAFCATCDAPLYRGKRVAVVGGGNSAFTAVRDLTGFASHIYLIHRSDVFKADPALVSQVRTMKNVTFMPFTTVREFLGRDSLTGVRLARLDGTQPEDLIIDGVFLEIGLTPNSDPVKDLIALNEKGEVPVTKENATALPGLFAAGDVTDNTEKQIAIAVGDGARAALTAHRYLLDKELTRSLVSVGDTWQ
jgi:alkyl hydroperoxide reductase subunit F